MNLKGDEKYRHRGSNGQALVEYVLALLGVMLIVTVLGFLVSGAWKSAERTTNLVQSDYP